MSSTNRRCPTCGITMSYLGGYRIRADSVPDEPPGPDATAEELHAHIEAMRSERNYLRAQLYEAARALHAILGRDVSGYIEPAATESAPAAEPAAQANDLFLFALPDVGV